MSFNDWLSLAQKNINPQWLGIVAGWIASGAALYQARRASKARKRQESPYFKHPELLILVRGEVRQDGTRSEIFSYAKGDEGVPDGYLDGDPVLIRATNAGGEARLVEIDNLSKKLDAKGEFWATNENPSLQFYYRYSLARRGKVERFRVRYETVSGDRGQQLFEFRHGLLGLKRVRIK